jgi:hypothetical protein
VEVSFAMMRREIPAIRTSLTKKTETLHIALDVSANGRIPLPGGYPDDNPSQIRNITIFLYSYDTGRNFTVVDGTWGTDVAPLGTVMMQEPRSTVKHINWVWPSCLEGNGQPRTLDSDRGTYNVNLAGSNKLAKHG